MNPKTFFSFLIFTSLSVIGVYLLLNRKPAPETSLSPTPTATPTVVPTTSASDTLTPAAAMTQIEITIEGDKFRFSPAKITLKKGQTIKLTLISRDMPHDFVVDELNFRTKLLQPGESQTLEFTPDIAGTFEYYCSFNRHRQMGMVGTLVVED